MSIKQIFWVLLIALMAALLSGCRSTKYITVPEVHSDTLYQARVEKDSVWLHDSVFVNQWQSGDTVYLTSYKWQTKYVERLRLDTIYRARVDSVPVPVPVEVKVPADLTWWQQFRLHLGNIALMVLGILALLGIAKWRGWQV